MEDEPQVRILSRAPARNAEAGPLRPASSIRRAVPPARPFGPARAPYSMSESISPGSSPASRKILRVTKFHTMTTAVANIFTIR